MCTRLQYGHGKLNIYIVHTHEAVANRLIYILEYSVVFVQVFSACNLVGRRLDKRRERQLLAEGQRATKESLFRSVSGATLRSDS